MCERTSDKLNKIAAAGGQVASAGGDAAARRHPQGRPGGDAADAKENRRELDARSGGGLRVRLLWDPVTDRVAVIVAETETGLEFEIPVGDGDKPLDVFHHPFAYALREKNACDP